MVIHMRLTAAMVAIRKLTCKHAIWAVGNMLSMNEYNIPQNVGRVEISEIAITFHIFGRSFYLVSV